MSKEIKSNINKHKQNPPLEVGFVYELKIDKLAIGGSGVGRLNNIVVFVPQTAPDELVKVKITEFKKNHAIAELVEIIKSSPKRINPPCEYFKECGGCPWQHIEESEQLNQKNIILREAFKKFLPDVNINIPEIIPSPKKLGYRNRIQPHYENGKIGYFKKKTHHFMPIQKCILAENSMNEIFVDIQNELSKKGIQNTKLEILLTPEHKVQWHNLEEEKDLIGFSQVNQYQNLDLIKNLMDWVSEKNYTEILDLYSGAGNFTFPLARKYSDAFITGVEANFALVKQAKEKKSGSKNKLQFYAAPVESFLRRYLPKSEDLLIVLDPPRAGCDEFTIRSIANLNFKKLIYISCHPISLVRDLDRLLKFRLNSNLSPISIKKVQSFEMFPQTDHFEVMVEVSVDS